MEKQNILGFLRTLLAAETMLLVALILGREKASFKGLVVRARGGGEGVFGVSDI